MPEAQAHHIECTNDEYHAREEWSQSQFKVLPEHPELFEGFHVTHRWTRQPTADMELGSHLHGVLLEGEELVLIPDDVLTKNGQRRGKNWDAWCEEHPNNPGILPKDAQRIQAMIDGCRADPEIASMLGAEGEVEHTIVWEHEETGLPLRARLDKIARYGEPYMIVDLKATNIDVGNQRAVSSKIYEFSYHQQAAHYLDAATLLYGAPLGFVFLFVRNKPPYNAVAWTLGEQDVELGRRHNRAALLDLRSRLDSSNWRGPRFGQVNTVFLPGYAYSDDPLGLPPAAPEPYDDFDGYQ